MRKSLIYTFFGIMSMIVLVACKPKQLIQPSTPPTPVETPKEDTKLNTLKLLKSKDLAFNTLSLRAKANLDVGGSENNVTMQMRIQKDKKIWISVTAIAGIEVARALITPDSIFVRNNLERSYLKKPLSFVNQYTNSSVNYYWIQALFAGNTIPDLMTPLVEAELNNGSWQINGSKESLLYQLQFNDLMKLTTSSLNDAKAGQALKVNYGSYITLSKGLFPSEMKLNTLSGTKKINLDLTFTKADVDIDLEYPFSIPKNFSQIQ